MIESPHQKEISTVVDHLFRREAGRMVATLTHIFGVENLDLAEDVVQEALLKALKQWSYSGIPENPAGWIMQVAKNQALDVIRRKTNFQRKQDSIVHEEESGGITTEIDELFLENEIADDQLRMMFTCCHPSLSEESQVALTLKTLCGFGVGEIARAFLAKDETIAKRLVRAKQKLKEALVVFEIPVGDELTSRLHSIHKVLYLLFNEGYNTSHGEDVIRFDLCEEAIRLTRLLTAHDSASTPTTQALLALMLLHASRMGARVNNEGGFFLLQDQDRNLWDAELAREGIHYLNLSAEGKEISQFHLEAGIAACHSLAQNYQSTDWGRIVALYNMLLSLNRSPIVALNRAVAISYLEGPEAAMESLEMIQDKRLLESYYLFHAVKGELHTRLNETAEAAHHYRKALSLTANKSEQQFLSKKLKICEEQIASVPSIHAESQK